LYPNPMRLSNSLLKVNYRSDGSEPITLKIFNIRGQLVYERSSVSRNNGLQELQWDGCDKRGNLSTSGVYLLQISQGKKSHKAKLLIAK